MIPAWKLAREATPESTINRRLSWAFQEFFFFDTFRRGGSCIAAVAFSQAVSSSPHLTEPVEGGASAISIAFFVAASPPSGSFGMGTSLRS